MYFEVTFRRIMNLEADSYEEAEDKALNSLHDSIHETDLTLAEIFDVGIKKEKNDLSTMGGG